MTRIKVDIWTGPLHRELLAETLHDSWDTAGPAIREALAKGQLANVLMDEVLTEEEELLLEQDDPVLNVWAMALQMSETDEAALDLLKGAVNAGAAIVGTRPKGSLN